MRNDQYSLSAPPILSDTCPACGYCRHCGRSNQPGYQPVSVYPQSTWNATPVTYTPGHLVLDPPQTEVRAC